MGVAQFRLPHQIWAFYYIRFLVGAKVQLFQTYRRYRGNISHESLETPMYKGFEACYLLLQQVIKG